MSIEPIDLAAFTCPRCDGPAAADYYGPCSACCNDLRVKLAGEATDLTVEAYEPKMNVTPNAVALKD